MSDRVRITDVAPRDGLQNEARAIPTDDKVTLIERLAASGVDEVEITSFVRPDWIPQLADAEQVCARIADFSEGVRMVAGELPRGVGHADTPGGGALPIFSALVPNEKGLDRALAFHEQGFGLKISLFASASETFSTKNTNASIDEVLQRFLPVIVRATDEKLPIRVYISCAIACPFEGPIEPAQVRHVCDRLGSLVREQGLETDAYELDLADTIGVAHPDDITALLDRFGEHEIAGMTLHLHDTNGAASDCVRTALAQGVRSFDGAASGLGGCPYASTPGRRAPGNLATHTLVSTVHDAGFQTGVDLALLEEASVFADRIVHGGGA